MKIILLSLVALILGCTMITFFIQNNVNEAVTDVSPEGQLPVSVVSSEIESVSTGLIDEYKDTLLDPYCDNSLYHNGYEHNVTPNIPPEDYGPLRWFLVLERDSNQDCVISLLESKGAVVLSYFDDVIFEADPRENQDVKYDVYYLDEKDYNFRSDFYQNEYEFVSIQSLPSSHADDRLTETTFDQVFEISGDYWLQKDGDIGFVKDGDFNLVYSFSPLLNNFLNVRSIISSKHDYLIAASEAGQGIVVINIELKELVAQISLPGITNDHYVTSGPVLSPDGDKAVLTYGFVNRDSDLTVLILNLNTLEVERQFLASQYHGVGLWTLDNKIIFNGSAPKNCAFYPNRAYYDFNANEFVDKPYQLSIKEYDVPSNISPNLKYSLLTATHEEPLEWYVQSMCSGPKFNGKIALLNQDNTITEVESVGKDTALSVVGWLPDSSGFIYKTYTIKPFSDLIDTDFYIISNDDRQYNFYNVNTGDIISDPESIDRILASQDDSRLIRFERKGERVIRAWTLENNVLSLQQVEKNKISQSIIADPASYVHVDGFITGSPKSWQYK